MPKNTASALAAAPTPTLDKYLSVNDVAAALGISDQVVHKLLRARRLPHSRVGRRIIIRKIDVEAMLEEARCS